MIPVVFYPGTHGNYVEFVLNKFLYGNQITMSSPFGHQLGTSHAPRQDPNYQEHKYFTHSPWPWFTRQPARADNIVKISFDPCDDLTVVQLNLKRGEDDNIDPNTLEKNTYFKLVNATGPEDNNPKHLIDRIQQYSSVEGYSDIKDNVWPDISTVEEFYNLPARIINECAKQFNFKPFQFDENHPDAPRWVLRDIFKNWFLDVNNLPSANMTEFDNFSKQKKVYQIPLRHLYNIDQFKDELKNIEKYFNLTFEDYDITDIHKEFVDRVPYLNSVAICNEILNSLKTETNIDINLTVVEEGFINAKIKEIYGVEMYSEDNNYFPTTDDLRKYVVERT